MQYIVLFYDNKKSQQANIAYCELVPVTGVEPVRYRYHWILSFTVRTEATVLWMNLAELATIKKARNIKAFPCLTPKIPIPQGFSRITVLTLKKEIGGPSEGHFCKI